MIKSQHATDFLPVQVGNHNQACDKAASNPQTCSDLGRANHNPGRDLYHEENPGSHDPSLAQHPSPDHGLSDHPDLDECLGHDCHGHAACHDHAPYLYGRDLNVYVLSFPWNIYLILQISTKKTIQTISYEV